MSLSNTAARLLPGRGRHRRRDPFADDYPFADVDVVQLADESAEVIADKGEARPCQDCGYYACRCEGRTWADLHRDRIRRLGELDHRGLLEVTALAAGYAPAAFDMAFEAISRGAGS